MLSDAAIATHFGFSCRYTPTIMSGPVVRWGTLFEVSASRDGVVVQGDSPTMPSTTALTKLLGFAEVVHRELARVDRRQTTMEAVKALLAVNDGIGSAAAPAA